MKKVAVILLTLAFAGVLAGCETVKGVGRDIEKAGESIEKAVD